MYISSNERVTVTDIQQVMDQLPEPFLLIADLNGRYTLWGNTEIHQRGRVLETISNGDICKVNAGQPHTSMLRLALSLVHRFVREKAYWTLQRTDTH